MWCILTTFATIVKCKYTKIDPFPMKHELLSFTCFCYLCKCFQYMILPHDVIDPTDYLDTDSFVCFTKDICLHVCDQQFEDHTSLIDREDISKAINDDQTVIRMTMCDAWEVVCCCHDKMDYDVKNI